MNSNTSLRILSIVTDTVVDGPGWRTSIYAAGCQHQCPECHNPQSWDMNGGEVKTIDEVMQVLRTSPNAVTFSGGDPLYQAAAFTTLAQQIREELHRTIWCYTGFLFEDVWQNTEQRALLPYLEVLVDGPYLAAQRSDTLLFRGSSNQRLIDVPKTLASGHLVLYEYNPYPQFD